MILPAQSCPRWLPFTSCGTRPAAGSLMVNDEQLLQGFRRCKELGAVPQVGGVGGACGGGTS